MQQEQNAPSVQKEGMFSVYGDLITNRKEYYKNIRRKGYFTWLINQMKGWSKFSYTLLAVNFIMQVYFLYLTFAGTATPSTRLAVGAIFGFIGGNLSVACVIGISNRSSIQGYFGITSAVAIGISAIMTHAYASAIEQLLIYIPFLDIPSILHPSWAEKIIPRSFKKIDWLKFTVFGLVSWAIVYAILFFTTNEATIVNDIFGVTINQAVTDSLALALALTGSLAMLNRYSNQYYFWLINNFVSIMIYAQGLVNGTASPALIVSYSIFVLNSVYGMYTWTRDSKKLSK